MHIIVESDKVVMGNEFIPRFLHLPSVLQVNAGQAHQVMGEETYDYVEVAGLVNVTGKLKATHIIVLPGGHINIESNGGEVIFRDVPLDPLDVHQWGNGLINFG